MQIVNNELISVTNEDIDNMSFSVPEGVITIRSRAFQDCTNLKSVFIPDSVENIQTRVFYNCNNLENITINNILLNVKVINHFCNIIQSTQNFSIYTLYKTEVLLNQKNKNLNFSSQYIASVEDLYAYGETAKHAIFHLTNKIFYKPLEEKLKYFKFEEGKKYKLKEFGKVHFMLTCACEEGRKNWIEENNFDLEETYLTLEEVKNLCAEYKGYEFNL